MGAANSVRRLTVESIALLEQLEPNAHEVRHKREVRDVVQRALAQEWPACRVVPFGSSESGVAFGGSDVDVGIYFDDMDVDYQSHLSVHERVQILRAAQTRLSDAFEVKEFVQNARVPVLKLWDPTRQVACDVCVGGVNALLNTALIRYYGQVDPRVRPLAFAVKYWAQRRGINDSVNGTLSSYGYALLVVFYLQSRHSPILLPSIQARFQALQSETNLSVLLQRLDVLASVALPSSSTFGTSFQDSVGALLAGFFQFYASQFNWEDDVVSIRVGAPLSKTTKWSHPVAWRLSIEDPFELAHDVGRVIFSRKGQELLNAEFRRACAMVCAGRTLHEICATDATSWNAHASCYICNSSDHKARECVVLQLKRISTGTSAGTGAGDALAVLADCWYCGECGHFKAMCPMLFFRNIPLHADSAAVAAATALPSGGAATRPQPMELDPPRSGAPLEQSQPISIARFVSSLSVSKRNLSPAPSVGEWERGFSLPLPAKKKRSRQGSSGSLALSPLLSSRMATVPPLVSPSLLPEKQARRKHRHRQQSPSSLSLTSSMLRKQQRVVRACGDVAIVRSSSSGSSVGVVVSGVASSTEKPRKIAGVVCTT